MSFLGVEYTYVKEENFTDFLKAVGVPAETIEKLVNDKPVSKIEKDGDNYTYTNISGGKTKTVTFKSGVEFEENLRDIIAIKTTYTVDLDNNRVTQVINSDRGSATFVRDFTDKEMVVTITSSVWPGTAKRFYKA